jgi:hypothetical protein
MPPAGMSQDFILDLAAAHFGLSKLIQGPGIANLTIDCGKLEPRVPAGKQACQTNCYVSM